MVVIEKHQSVLARLGLGTVEQFQNFQAEVLENVPGKRDVLRIRTTDEHSRELILYLKRHWRTDRKDGLKSLLQHGRVWSVARLEWENAKALQRAGLHTAGLVAYVEVCGPFWEHFSCLLTQAAAGPQTLHQFLRECRDRSQRRRVFDALAREIRRMHGAGLSMPDLFTRHIFFDPAAPELVFSFIDMARLDRGRRLPAKRIAQALAALNVSAPLRFVSTKERVRFLRQYAGDQMRTLVRPIAERTKRLLGRKKYRDFLAPPK